MTFTLQSNINRQTVCKRDTNCTLNLNVKYFMACSAYSNENANWHFVFTP